MKSFKVMYYDAGLKVIEIESFGWYSIIHDCITHGLLEDSIFSVEVLPEK